MRKAILSRENGIIKIPLFSLRSQSDLVKQVQIKFEKMNKIFDERIIVECKYRDTTNSAFRILAMQM
ncbi:hypothetical protein BLOT_015131 [Blomia tropicalis]|nr:hypothetical protein BLOT_015131 [Blomia tropicalis]